MRGYHQLHLARSACIHFVSNVDSEEAIEAAFQPVFDGAIDCVYVDFAKHERSAGEFVNTVAERLHLEHAPYSANLWLRWLDDLITLSCRSSGVVIVIDNADALLRDQRDQMFDLIEAFLTQFHHWFEKKKPCHCLLYTSPSPRD